MPAEIDLDAYYAFDAGAGAGIPSEDTWEQVMSRMLLPGVIAGEPFGTTPGTTEFQVYGDSTGRQVKVRIGRAIIFGHPGWNTSEKTLAISANGSGNPRIDAVIARLDRSNNKILLTVIEGTPSVTPAAPALAQTAGGVFDVLLAYVTVANGATTINAADVSDRRTWAIPDDRGKPTAGIARTTNQTGVTSGVQVPVTFEAADYLTGGVVWAVSDPTKLYLPRPGLYRATGRLRWSNNNGGYRQVSVLLNGSAVLSKGEQAPTSGEAIMETGGEVRVTNATSYLQLSGLHTAGVSLTYEIVGYAPKLSVELIRPTALS